MPDGVVCPRLPVETGELFHSAPSLNTYIVCDGLLITISTPDLSTAFTAGGNVAPSTFVAVAAGTGSGGRGGTFWTTGLETNSIFSAALAEV